MAKRAKIHSDAVKHLWKCVKDDYVESRLCSQGQRMDLSPVATTVVWHFVPARTFFPLEPIQEILRVAHKYSLFHIYRGLDTCFEFPFLQSSAAHKTHALMYEKRIKETGIWKGFVLFDADIVLYLTMILLLLFEECIKNNFEFLNSEYMCFPPLASSKCHSDV